MGKMLVTKLLQQKSIFPTSVYKGHILKIALYLTQPTGKMEIKI